MFFFVYLVYMHLQKTLYENKSSVLRTICNARFVVRPLTESQYLLSTVVSTHTLSVPTGLLCATHIRINITIIYIFLYKNKYAIRGELQFFVSKNKYTIQKTQYDQVRSSYTRTVPQILNEPFAYGHHSPHVCVAICVI